MHQNRTAWVHCQVGGRVKEGGERHNTCGHMQNLTCKYTACVINYYCACGMPLFLLQCHL